MSKVSSSLFSGTLGEQAPFGEDHYTRYLSNGMHALDVRHLPGSSGIRIPKRLNPDQMMFLTEKYGVEFAQVYVLGSGSNGRGGQYYLYSGTRNSVVVPVRSNTILISHTHPGGTAYPSKKDRQLMALLESAGSPQRTSSIIPKGKGAIRFTKKGLKRDER